MKASTKQRIIDNARKDKITKIGKYEYFFNFASMCGFCAIYRRDADRLNILLSDEWGKPFETNPWYIYERISFDQFGKAI